MVSKRCSSGEVDVGGTGKGWRLPKSMRPRLVLILHGWLQSKRGRMNKRLGRHRGEMMVASPGEKTQKRKKANAITSEFA